MNTPVGSARRGWGFVLVGLLWLGSYMFSRMALETAPAELWQRIGLTLLSLPAAIVFVVMFVRHIRGLDELQRRVHLEALAIAFPLTVLMLMTLGLLQLVVTLPEDDWSYRQVWHYLPLFYFLGLAFASRRYR